MIRHFILFVFCSLLSISALYSQQKDAVADSLLRLFPTQKNDRQIENWNYQLASYYNRTDLNKSMPYLREALRLSQKIGSDTLICDVFNQYGYYYYELGANDSAAVYWEKSLDCAVNAGLEDRKQAIAENLTITLVENREFERAQAVLTKLLYNCKQSNDRLCEARVLSDFGLMYDYMGNYLAATEHYQKSLALLENIPGQEKFLASALFSLGLMHSSSGNHQLAKNYYLRALRIYENRNMKPSMAQCYGNLGNVYEDLSRVDSAVWCQQNSYRLAVESGNREQAGFALTNLASLQVKQNRIDEARLNYHRGLAIKKSLGNEIRFCSSYIGLSGIMLQKNLLDSAKYYILEAKRIAEAYGDVEYQRDAQEALANYYEKKGNFREAYFAYKNFKILNDSLVKSSEILQLEIGRNFEREGRLKAERDLAQAETEKKTARLRLWQLAVLAAGILAGFFIYFFFRIKKQKNLLELLYQELRHRTKNYLQILGGIFTLQSDGATDKAQIRLLEEGRRRVDAMKILEQRLLKADKAASVVNAGEYLSEIIDSMAKVTPTGAPIVFNKNLEPLDMDITKAMSVGIIVNELLMNVVKHAAGTATRPQVSVSLTGGEQTTLVVEDNGAGLPENYNPQLSESFGLKLVNLFAARIGARLSIRNTPGARFEFVF